MEANELRIGNWVWEDYSGNMLVSQITYSTESVFLRKGWLLIDGKYLCNAIKPIPLTKDWLLKFHSVDEIEVSARFQNEITIYDRFLLIWKEEYEFWYVVTADHKEYLTKIEFVHEYQNFIFALTGQELELK
jgi:hypothetical protein